MGSQFVICCNFVSKLLAYLYTAVSLDWVIMGLLYDFSSTIEPPVERGLMHYMKSQGHVNIWK